jgi:hypothetical protein
MTVPWIGPTAHPTEEFECLDCFLVATLNVHGRCERCNSNAVFPFQTLEKTGRWITVRGVRFWVPSIPEYLSNKQTTIAFAEQDARIQGNARPRAKASPITAPIEKKCA